MKGRVPVPKNIRTQVLYASDRTCCVCAELGIGKDVQIHHIDGNRNNNAFENLAVLCLECHHKTQVSGGFTQRLSPEVVIEHRNNWHNRVTLRRNRFDEMAVTLSQQRELPSSNLSEHKELKSPPVALINSLPELKATLLAQVRPKWDTGVTSTMVEGWYDYIDSFVAILVTLSSYYPTGQFGDQSLEEYFSKIVSSRQQWHRAIAEPEGRGTGGTIISLIVASGVQADLETMVEDVVKAIILGKVDIDYDSLDLSSWSKRWRSD